MTVESATYLHELNTGYPTATDFLTQGDDHLRLIKAALRATFPNFAGAVTLTHAELNALATDYVSKVAPEFTGAPTEGVYTVDSGATVLYAADGGIQLITLPSNKTYTLSLASGQSISLVVSPASYTMTLSGVTWVWMSNPTLSTTKTTFIDVFKIGGTTYAMLVGYSA